MKAQICTGETDGNALIPAAELDISDSKWAVMLCGYDKTGGELTVSVGAHGRTEDDRPTVAEFRMTVDEFDRWVDQLIDERASIRKRGLPKKMDALG